MSNPSIRWSDERLQEFRHDFDVHCRAFDTHCIDERDMWTKMLSGYPNEDPLAHRLYHEAVMRAADAQEKFWNELRLDLAKKSFWAVSTLLVGLMLAGLAAKTGFTLGK